VRRIVTLVGEREGEVVEGPRRIAVLGAKPPFVYRQCVAKKRNGFGVSPKPVEMIACLLQNEGPACNLQSVAGVCFAPCKQMRGKLAAHIRGRINRYQPCN
jgi:hypothetical protein